MTKFAGSAVALAAALAGCATYEPLPLDPAAELAALRRTTLDGLVVRRARPGSQDDAPAPAFDPSDGLDESEVVAAALTLNPGLAAKRLEIGEADALLVGAGLWPNPSLAVSWRSGIGGAAGHAVDADLLVDLLQPARRAARVDAASARRDAVVAGIVAAEWQVVREVRLRRIDVLAAEQTLALLTEEEALRERTLDLARRRRAAGEGTELDVAAADLDRAEVSRERLRAEADVESARRALNETIGLPPGCALRLSDTGRPLAVTVFDDVADDELDRRLVAGRFDLRALESAYAQAEHELRGAMQRWLPRLSLGVSYERDAGGDEGLGPAAEFEVPLFDRNQGEIAEKRAARDRARAAYVEGLHRARAEAFEARALCRRARAEVDVQERELLPLVQRSGDLVERAFLAREIDALAVVAAQERALRARESRLASVVRYQRGVVELETATGMPLARSPQAPVPDGGK